MDKSAASNLKLIVVPRSEIEWFEIAWECSEWNFIKTDEIRQNFFGGLYRVLDNYKQPNGLVKPKILKKQHIKSNFSWIEIFR